MIIMYVKPRKNLALCVGMIIAVMMRRIRLLGSMKIFQSILVVVVDNPLQKLVWGGFALGVMSVRKKLVVILETYENT